jgi:hypothetical protein
MTGIQTESEGNEDESPPSPMAALLLERFQRHLKDSGGEVNPFAFFRHFEKELEDAKDARWLLAGIFESSADFLESFDETEGRKLDR